MFVFGGGKMAVPDNKLQIEMLRKMMLIRAFEEKIKYLFTRGAMAGFSHLYDGQEAVAVGGCAALTRDDYITSTHRGHGHCIAKGGDVAKMMAEVLGRRTGYCKGKGGSMHIFDASLGILGANGIVAGGLPMGTGAGLKAKLTGSGQVTMCFFGDGTTNQGTFHESLNMAGLWRLPVVYVCENNGYGISVSQARHQAIRDVAVRAEGYGMVGAIADGNDVLDVYEKASAAVERARRGEGPTLLECKTYRYGGHHVGDPGTLYRSNEEVAAWRAKDPIPRMIAHVLDSGVMTQAEVDTLKAEVDAEIEAAAAYSLESPLPEPEEALDDLFIGFRATGREGRGARGGCAAGAGRAECGGAEGRPRA
jgi:pyruvate dehydrogenase E1 component alpha subunit